LGNSGVQALKDKLKVPEKYYDVLPEFLRGENLSEELTRFRNSILWCLYLYDLSEEERKRVIKKLLELNIEFLPNFDPIQTILGGKRKAEIFVQLLKEFLQKAKRIKKIPSTHLAVSSIYDKFNEKFFHPFSKKEYKVLTAICKNPLISFRDLAKKTGFSVSGVRKIYLKIRDRLRFTSMINLHALKLRHLTLIISGLSKHEEEHLKNQFMKSVWLRTIYSFASNPELLVVSVNVPNDVKFLKEFLRGIKSLEKLWKIELYDVSTICFISNLSLYNPKKMWEFNPEKLILRRLKSDEDTCIRCVKYFSISDLKLSREDLYIIESLLREPRIGIEILTDLPTNTSTSTWIKRRRDFFNKKILVPTILILDPRLKHDGILITESQEKLTALKRLFLSFPYIFLYNMQKIYPNTCNALLVYYRVPAGTIWRFLQVLNNVKKKLNIKKIYYEYQGIGSYSFRRFLHRWDEEKQQWVWCKEDVDVFKL